MAVSEGEKRLLDSLKALNITPKADTPDELLEWLKAYGSKAAKEKTEIKVSTNQPKLSIFYGDTVKLTKGEVLYDQWKYELECLMKENYTHEQIMQAIRRSVKGDAAGVLKRLKDVGDATDVVKKFESVFGDSESKSSLLKKFYSAEQMDDEDIQHWSCRLEGFLDNIIEQGLVPHHSQNQMLCEMFWAGMRTELKDLSGYKFDTIKDFDKLRTEVKKIEQDHVSKKAQSHVAVAKSAVDKKDDSVKGEMAEMRKLIKSVEANVQDIGQQLEHIKSVESSVQQMGDQLHHISTTVARQQTYSRGFGRGRGFRGRRGYQNSHQGPYYSPPYQQGLPYHQGAQNAPSYAQGGQNTLSSPQNAPSVQQETQNVSGAQRGRAASADYNNVRPKQNVQSSSGFDSHGYYDDANSGPLCFRCRQRGHYQWQCVTRMDHSWLN